MSSLRSTRRGIGSALALLTAGVVAATVAAGAPAAAEGAPGGTASCTVPFVTIHPAFAQNRDMALGLPNGPLADRDATGISYAETWREFPAGGGSIKIVNRHVANGVEAAVSVNTGGLPADAVISEPTAQADRWFRETVGGFTRYRNANDGRYITYVPGDPTAPFRARTSGQGQYFAVVDRGC